jgi:hypothetical protein
MSKRHPFRPSLNDIVLEDRVVLQSNASLAAELSALSSASRAFQSYNNFQTRTQLGDIVNTGFPFNAFSTFGLNNTFTGSNASSQIQTIIGNIRNSANAQAYFEQLQAQQALAPVANSSSLTQIIRSQLGDNTQPGSMISAWQTTLSAIPTTPGATSNAVPGVNQFSSGLGSIESASALAVQNEFDIFTQTPNVVSSGQLGSRSGRTAQLLLLQAQQQASSLVSSTQSQINSAFASFQTQITNAYSGAVSGGNITQSSINTLNNSIITNVNSLNTQIQGIISKLPQAGTLTPYVQNQLIGLDQGSLLQGLLGTTRSFTAGPDVTDNLSTTGTASGIAKSLISVANFAVNNQVQVFANALTGR